MEFSDVFDSNNGFDIIIGNPPYFRVTTASKLEQKVLGKLGILKDFHHGQGDIYYDFVVRSFELLREGGQLIFITSRYWLESTYANYMKKYLKERVEILKILDFRELLLFKGVDIHNSILYYEKTQPKKKGYEFEIFLFNEKNLRKEKNLEIPDDLDNVGFYNIKEWDANENWAFVPRKHKDFFLKIKNISTKLGDDYNCNQYSNCFRKKHKSIFIFENKIGDIPVKYLRNYLKMGDINKYSPNYNLTKYCLVVHNKQLDFKNEKLLDFFKKQNISYEDIIEIKEDSDKNIDKFEDLIYIGYRIPRIIYNFVYSNTKTWIDNTYFITLKKNTAFSLRYLVAVLNSDLYRYYIDIVGKKKENEIEIGSTFLKNLPLILRSSLLTSSKLNYIKVIDKLIVDINEREFYGEEIPEHVKKLNDLIFKLYDVDSEEQNLIKEYIKNIEQKFFNI